MACTRELPPDADAHAQAQSDAQGVAVEDSLRLLIKDGLPVPKPRPAAELAALLEKKGRVGLWAGRTDIGDSAEYTCTLRCEAEMRGHD